MFCIFLSYFVGVRRGGIESRHLDNCSIRGHLNAATSPIARLYKLYAAAAERSVSLAVPPTPPQRRLTRRALEGSSVKNQYRL